MRVQLRNGYTQALRANNATYTRTRQWQDMLKPNIYSLVEGNRTLRVIYNRLPWISGIKKGCDKSLSYEAVKESYRWVIALVLL